MAPIDRSRAAIVFLLLLFDVTPQWAAAWGWSSVPNRMADQRWAPSYCLLGDGRSALIAGGYSYARLRCVASADLYLEDEDRFMKTDSRLITPRDFATATLLPDGRALIAGGFNDVLGSLNSAELFDPTNRRFEEIDARMVSPRELHTATLLNDGTVLIVGGLDLWDRRTQRTAEIFNPSTGAFSRTKGLMRDDRFGHAACLLADGRVLIVGGTSVLFGRNGFSRVLSSAEIYDTATGCFTPAKSEMSVARDRPTATLLPDGDVLIAGGEGPNGASVAYSEIFDPRANAFLPTQVKQNAARMAHCAALLLGHDVLLAGGWSAPLHATTASTELYDPVAGKFQSGAALPFTNHDAAMVVFADGKTLVAGGKSVQSDGVSTALTSGAVASPP